MLRSLDFILRAVESHWWILQVVRSALYRMNPGLTLSVGLRQGEDKVAG